MRAKKYNKPFRRIVVEADVRFAMDGGLWDVRCPNNFSDLVNYDAGLLFANAPEYSYSDREFVNRQLAALVRDRSFNRPTCNMFKMSWKSEPIALPDLTAGLLVSLYGDVEAVMRIAASSVCPGEHGREEENKLGVELGASELVRQHVRVAATLLLSGFKDLLDRGDINAETIVRQEGISMVFTMPIAALSGRDSVILSVSFKPDYEDEYVRKYLPRFRRKHDRARYKRLACRFKELKAKCAELETKLRFAEAQKDAVTSRFLAYCNRSQEANPEKDKEDLQ